MHKKKATSNCQCLNKNQNDQLHKISSETTEEINKKKNRYYGSK